MLSYQHAYHAGNLADVHKHALLAVALARLTEKPKALTYLETHAGRALYDLGSPEAMKTGEAAAGIAVAGRLFAADHPYAHAIAAARAAHGPAAYPGSPWIAAHLLRPGDRLWLAEAHPAEAAALAAALRDPRVEVRAGDGPALARSVLPPTPRRGLALIDPSWELRAEADAIPALAAELHRKWNVGVIAVWLPVLADGRLNAAARRLAAIDPGALVSTVRFPPARPGHGMVGSVVVVLNPPYGLAEEAARLSARFAALPQTAAAART